MERQHSQQRDVLTMLTSGPNTQDVKVHELHAVT